MRCVCIFSGFAFLLSALTAYAASPSLGVITPRGVQRGTETVLNFDGGRLADTAEIFFYQPGFEVVKIEAKDNQAVVTVRIAPDCKLGEHTAQVRTKTGISEYRTFFVGALPAVDEKEPNTDFAAPQKIELNSTVRGVVQNEDVDYYALEAKKGQRIAVEVEGMRFGQTMFDPYVAILDSKRFELAAADDSPLVKQDAVASIVAPEDGTYVIEVREGAYGGNGNCRYRLHVGTFPRPTAVYPAGGKIGEEIEVTFIGDATGDMKRTIKVPDELDEQFGVFAQDDGGIAPSQNVFRVYEHGNAFEVEPNDDMATATPVETPNAFNGILNKAGDVDFFRFSAKKGQVVDIECFGRRIRSAVDPVMNLYKADGGGVADNDDSRGPDSYFRFTPPADGEYILRITDHLSRGGPEYVYRIEFHPIKPKLTLGIPRVARYSQSRQQIYVPKGNRFATLMSFSRANFGGELVIEDNDLPAGLRMVTETIPGNMSTWPIVFEAAPDAALSGKLLDFRARHADANQNISGGFHNRADFVIASPGQSLYVWKDVERLPVAVIDEVPFKIEIVQPKVPIVRNGSMNLIIRATKKEGWDEQINVQFPFRPPGVGGASSINIPKGQTEANYPLSANGNAQIRKWPVYALGQANAGGTAWVASQMASLEIAEPYFTIAMERADVEQGKTTEVVCSVEVTKEFPGNAKVQLLGLPHKVTTNEMEMNKDTKELIFPVKTEKDSPAGNHKNVFCRVTVIENNEPVMHARVGDTELRVDKPLPKPVAAAPKPKKEPKPMPTAAAEPKPAPKKRLTRLQKLRLEAKERAAARAAALTAGA